MNDDRGQRLVQIERVTDMIAVSGLDRDAVRHMVAVAADRLGSPAPTDEALMDEAMMIEYVPGSGGNPLEPKEVVRRAEERAARREGRRDQPWRKGHA